MTRIPVVNEEDEIIGYKERSFRNNDEITRVTGLWLKDQYNNMLLAQRAFTKKDSPGLWGPAVAGTVEEGETYESNIIKEAEEEIGLKNLKPTLGVKSLRNTSHKYFAQRFTAVVDHDYPFVKQDDEVEAIKWFSKDELLNLIKEKPEIFLPSFETYLEDITNFLK